MDPTTTASDAVRSDDAIASQSSIPGQASGPMAEMAMADALARVVVGGGGLPEVRAALGSASSASWSQTIIDRSIAIVRMAMLLHRQGAALSASRVRQAMIERGEVPGDNNRVHLLVRAAKAALGAPPVRATATAMDPEPDGDGAGGALSLVPVALHQAMVAAVLSDHREEREQQDRLHREQLDQQRMEHRAACDHLRGEIERERRSKGRVIAGAAVVVVALVGAGAAAGWALWNQVEQRSVERERRAVDQAAQVAEAAIRASRDGERRIAEGVAATATSSAVHQ